MFTATLQITANVQEDEQGYLTFKVYAEPLSSSDLWLLLSTTYIQDVYRLLWEGDTLTVTFHTSKEERKIVANFRSDEQVDYVFEVDGQEPTPDLLYPLLEERYQKVLQTLQADDALAITFHIHRV